MRGKRAFARARNAVLVALLVIAARPAASLTIGGAGGPTLEVEPIWFTAFGQFGLESWGSGPNYVAMAPVPFLSIGPEPGTGMDLALTQNLHEPVIQHPQDPGNSQNPNTNGGVPGTPTKDVPFVADSTWTVRNVTGRPVEDLVLLFTRVVDDPGYPAVDVALDENVYDVMLYTNASNVTRSYGAIALGDLGVGDSVDFDIRYIVSGALPIANGKYVMPRFGLAGIESPREVPEPGTVILLGLGLAGIARRRRD